MTEEIEKMRYNEIMQKNEEMKKRIAESEEERAIFNSIDKVMTMPGINRYFPKLKHIRNFATIYDNNYIDASGSEFAYGFYQGIRYAQAQAKKKAKA